MPIREISKQGGSAGGYTWLSLGHTPSSLSILYNIMYTPTLYTRNVDIMVLSPGMLKW